MVRPSGLFSFAANFAVVLSPLTPIEHRMPEVSKTFFFASCAMCGGEPSSRWQCVISRKASSTEKISMSGVISFSAAMMAADVAA